MLVSNTMKESFTISTHFILYLGFKNSWGMHLILMPCNSLRLIFLVAEMKLLKKNSPFLEMVKRRLGLLQMVSE